MGNVCWHEEDYFRPRRGLRNVPRVVLRYGNRLVPVATSQETAQSGYEVGDFALNVVDIADPSSVTEVEMPDYEGRKQVSVTADVANNSDEGVDLACSTDLEVQIASNGSAWGNVGYLERVPGNPQCGDLLAPGETKQMTWVSLMP